MISLTLLTKHAHPVFRKITLNSKQATAKAMPTAASTVITEYRATWTVDGRTIGMPSVRKDRRKW